MQPWHFQKTRKQRPSESCLTTHQKVTSHSFLRKQFATLKLSTCRRTFALQLTIWSNEQETIRANRRAKSRHRTFGKRVHFSLPRCWKDASARRTCSTGTEEVVNGTRAGLLIIYERSNFRA